MTLRKTDFVGHAIHSIWEGVSPNRIADDGDEWVYYDWYVRLDDGRIVKLGSSELSLASVDASTLQPSKPYGTQWVRAADELKRAGSPSMVRDGQFLSNDDVRQRLVGQRISEVIIEDDCGDDQLILVLDNGCHLYNANREGGNILQFDMLDERYEDHSRDGECRTYFERLSCDHLGNPVR